MSHVCVIEDDAAIREAVRSLLEDAGYGVHEAADGPAGLALLRASPGPLVVVLDHRLPNMNGCDLLKLVRSDRALQRHAYIYVTATHRTQIRLDCDHVFEEVGVAVVYKPFNLDHLLDAVAEAERNLVAGRPNALYAS